MATEEEGPEGEGSRGGRGCAGLLPARPELSNSWAVASILPFQKKQNPIWTGGGGGANAANRVSGRESNPQPSRAAPASSKHTQLSFLVFPVSEM